MGGGGGGRGGEGGPIVSFRGEEIQFPGRMATYLSWSGAASHLVSVDLTP